MSTLIVLSCDWSIHRPVELATLVAAAALSLRALVLIALNSFKEDNPPPAPQMR